MRYKINKVYLVKPGVITLFLLFFFAQILFSQNNEIDSLNSLLKQAKNDSIKIYLFNQLSNTYLKMGNIDKAIDFATNAYKKGYKLNSSEVLAKSFGKMKNYSKAYQYLIVYTHLHDSIVRDSFEQKIRLIENEFQDAQNTKIIELEKKLQDTISLKKTEGKKINRYSAVAGLSVLVFIIFFFMLRINRVKRATKKQLVEKTDKLKLQEAEIEKIRTELNQKYEDIKAINDELHKQKKEIEEKNAELEAQNEEISTQRDMLSTQNLSINDSIQYAKRIQNAVLPQQAYIDEILPDNFIFYRPRDTVSGDFYWVRQINQYVVVAVADCTGHGVPGAIMSMLGISFLNEIVQKREITEANQILNSLRKQIKHALKQTGRDGGIIDGMDIALCVLDSKSKSLQYAGANNSLFLVQNGKPLEIHPDKMPIGFYPDEKLSFTNHEILLNEGDIFYLFTDGFVDQQGGSNGSRYKTVNFQNFLFTNHSKPMEILKKTVEQELHNWMNGSEQTDDILVMGVRV
jgi:serine phosphatase RsbU (regulator of sigma subunit)